MDTPFTQYSITEKAIQDFGNPNIPANSVLMNAPSVKGGATLTHNDFSIRGHYLQGASFYVNGIPGLYSQMIAPTNMIERIELISGPNMLSGTQMEKNSVAGTVNFISKRAKQESITRYTQTFTGRGNFAEYVDIGSRFGKNDNWGIRFNGALQNGEMSIKNSGLKTKSYFLNVDHKDEKSSSNLFMGYIKQEVLNGMRWFKIGSKLDKIPNLPDSSMNVSFDQMLKEEESWLLAFNHNQRLNQNIDWFMNVGMLNSDLKRNISPQSSAYTILNSKGDYEFKVYNGRTPNSYRYYQTGFNAKFNTGRANHEVVLAIDDIAQKSYTNSKLNKSGSITYHGNIFDGNPNIPWQDLPLPDKILSADTNIWGLTLMDNIKMDKFRIVVGGHHHSADVKSYNKDGKQTKRVEASEFSPVYGFLYQPNDKMTFYASHTEGFSKGDIVSGGMVNDGEILPPYKSKENEFGIKWMNRNILTTISYFDIKEAQNITVDKPEGPYKVQDGEVEYQGVEFSVNGKLNEKWNVFGGAMYVNSTRNRTDKGIYDGYPVDGSSKWNAVAGFEYTPTKKTSIFTRMLYNGATTVGNDKFRLPSYMTFDLGVRHKMKLGGIDTTLGLTCYNVTDRSYWMTKNSPEILLSLPRTWMLSAQFDF